MNKIKLKDISLFKTLKFNIHYFGFKEGLKMPVYVSKYVHFICLKGNVQINNSKICRGIIHFGFDHIGWQFNRNSTYGTFYNKGSIELGNNIEIGMGSSIAVLNNAHLSIDDDSFLNAKVTIISTNDIKIGKGCKISWNSTLIDNDLHSIIDLNTNQVINNSKEIIVKDHCWIGFESKILKGTEIGPNVIVGCNSLISKKFAEPNIIVGG